MTKSSQGPPTTPRPGDEWLAGVIWRALIKECRGDERLAVIVGERFAASCDDAMQVIELIQAEIRQKSLQ